MKNSKVFFPHVYCSDELMTLSGLDGKTDYANMFTLISGPERFTYFPIFPFKEGCIRIKDRGGEVTIGNDFADLGTARMLLADSYNLLIEGRAIVTDYSDDHYILAKKGNKMLFSVKGFERPDYLNADFEALRKSKNQAFSILKDFLPGHLDKRTGEAVSRAWEVLRACIYTPEEKFRGYWATPDRVPHRACWIMDSVYQAYGMRHFFPEVAQDMVCALFDHQCEDGRIPMTASPLGSIRAQSQQPIIAAGARAVGIHGARLKEIYPKLTRYINWFFDHRDQDGDGLLEWMMGGGYPLCPCGESGMDNSPRFDERNPLASVDLNCFISLECETMAGFAEELGRPEECRMWEERHARLNALIEKYFWNNDMGFYCDMDIADERLIPVSAVSGFMPLICGAASPMRARRLAELAMDPNEYGTVYPLPSVSLSEPGFKMDMWRGPVWYIFNHHVALGLDRYGFHREADVIRAKTVEASVRYCQEFGGFFEFYDPNGKIAPGDIDRKGANEKDFSFYHRAIHDYGWSAAIFLDMLHHLKGCSL